jgi:hypothetical protein
MMSENLARIYVVEIKMVSLPKLVKVKKEKGELKNEADHL